MKKNHSSITEFIDRFIRRHKIFNIAFYFLCLSLQVAAQGNQGLKLSCERDTSRCWYIVATTGVAPDRIIVFADFNVTQVNPGVVQINTLIAHENTKNKDFYTTALEFDKKKKLYRSVGAYVVFGDGKIQLEAGSKWDSVPSGWLERVALAANEPNVRSNPGKHGMAAFAGVFRPIDVVDLARAFLWKPVQKDLNQGSK